MLSRPDFKELILNVLSQHKIKALQPKNVISLPPDILDDLKTRTDENDLTALHHCVGMGNLDAVRFMIETVGLSINLFDDMGRSPLEYAIKHPEIYAYLKAHSKNLPSITELHQAAYNADTAKMAELLVENPDLLEIPDYFGNTPLHLAVQSCRSDAVQLLLDEGAQTNVKNRLGQTPFDIAEGLIDIQEMLMEQGATETATKIKNPGYIAIHEQARTGNLAELKKSLDSNPPWLKVTDRFGHQPLTYAIMGGHVEVVKELLKRGASVQTININGKSPAHFCVYGEHAELEGKNYEITPNHLRILELIIAQFANVNLGRVYSHETPLHYAVLANNLPAINILLPYANRELKNFQGMTPLHLAITNGHVEAARALIANGARLDTEDDLGLIPLFNLLIKPELSIDEKIKTIRLLKLDLNKKNSHGDTVLHWLILSPTLTVEDKVNLMKALVMLGLDPNLTNQSGQTALHSAVLEDSKEIIAYLKTVTNLDIKDMYGNRAMEYTGKVAIDQGTINDALVLFCQSQDYDTDFIDERGNCAGWSFLYRYYCTLGKEETYFELLRYVLKYKDHDTLLDTDEHMPAHFKSLKYANGKRVYPTGRKLFEGLINDLAWFQNSALFSKRVIRLQQRDKLKLWDLVKDSGFQLKSIFDNRNLLLLEADIPGLLHLGKGWPGCWVDVTLHNATDPERAHNINLFYMPNGKIKYFDSNFDFEIHELDTIDQVMAMVQLTKTFMNAKEIDVGNFSVYRFFAHGEPVPPDFQYLSQTFLTGPKPALSQNALNELLFNAVYSGQNSAATLFRSMGANDTLATVLVNRNLSLENKKTLMMSMQDANLYDLVNGASILFKVISQYTEIPTEVVQLLGALKELGVDLDNPDVNDWQLVHYPFHNDIYFDIETSITYLRALKQLGCDMNIIDNDGRHIIDHVMESEHFSLPEKMQMLSALKPLGISVDTISHDFSVIHYVCADPDIDIDSRIEALKTIKSLKGHINLRSNENYLPVFLAWDRTENQDKFKLLKAFIELGVDVNAVDRTGFTLLHEIVGNSDDMPAKLKAELILLLGRHGANANVKTQKLPHSPLEIAKDQNDSIVIAALTQISTSRPLPKPMVHSAKAKERQGQTQQQASASQTMDVTKPKK